LGFFYNLNFFCFLGLGLTLKQPIFMRLKNYLPEVDSPPLLVISSLSKKIKNVINAFFDVITSKL